MSPAFDDAAWSALLASLPDAAPAVVNERARLHLLDLIGVAAGAAALPITAIAQSHSVAQFGAGARGARLLFDGRRASPTGAALANALSIDGLDSHDGHKLTKGHIGCGLLPALLAVWDAEALSGGQRFLHEFVLGTEFGARAGVALHATAAEYHTSGAWIAPTAAFTAARALGLDSEATRHAIGAAEYHGPRSPMMRCIDHPIMAKDGSGWGAMTGVSSAYLARDGFTGAPAETVEGAAIAEIWADFGQLWRLPEQYIKLLPVCYWGHAPAFAAMALRRAHAFPAEAVVGIAVETFANAARLATIAPRTTEEAQYSLPFALATALRFGEIRPEHVHGPALSDPETLRLSGLTVISVSETYEARYPAERWAQVSITLQDGRVLRSEPTSPPGGPEAPADANAVIAKFRQTAGGALSEARMARIIEACLALPDDNALASLLDEIYRPVS